MPVSKTPLRYPGGKLKLYEFVLEIIKENQISTNYVEPYAGGAGVAIELLLKGEVENIYLNDIDKSIYSFWYSVLNHTDELCELIYSANLSVDEWRKHRENIKNKAQNNHLSLGFSLFYLNRVNRSGVISAGLIGGQNQNGNYKMNARFNKLDLIKRINSIASKRNNIFLSNSDAMEFVSNISDTLDSDTLVYLDPPYYEKGSQLYLNSYKHEDHQIIAESIQDTLSLPWILSYDSVFEIKSLYQNRRQFDFKLRYSAGATDSGTEVFIFSDEILLPKSSKLENISAPLKELLVGHQISIVA